MILIAACALISCRDFMDKNPLDNLPSSSFWKTERDFNNALAACYATMQASNFSYGTPVWDNISDNGYGQHDYGGSMGIVTGNITPYSGGFVAGVYSQSYSAITRINIFLQNLKDFQGVGADVKIRSEAEARMLRAFYYSFLYRCYGDVPIVDAPLTLDNQYQPKKPAAEVLGFLMTDLDFAIANLANKTYSENKGRWTVNAAKAYKARILLYDAYDEGGNAIASRMSAVKELLSGITGYAPAEEFSDNFSDLRQEGCREIMFSVKFLAPNNKTDADMWYGDWIVVSPTAGLVGAFDMADGSPGKPVPYGGKGVIDPSKFNNDSLELREPRAAKTLFINSYRIGGGEHIPSNNRPLGTGLSKFFSPNLDAPYGYSTYSQQDWVILRYADVLLMLAEAENELHGPTATVYAAIDSIRLRGQTSRLPAGLNKEQMRERIRHERRVELAFEGQRYFDLKRWKIAKQTLNNVSDGLLTFKFDDKHYLWPLPQTEIEKAKGILIQNPDYR